MLDIDGVKFRLVKIELLGSSFKIPDEPWTEEGAFRFGLSITQSFDLKRELVVVTTEVKVFPSENKEFEAGNITTNCVYAVEGLATYVNGEEANLPLNLSVTLNSVSISTTRGMMYSEFKGTILQKAYLPIIDPNSYT